MSKIYNFPTPEDRAFIIDAARLCARSTRYRVAAMRIVADVLRKYGVRRMHVGGLVVEDYGDITSPTGFRHSAILMEATELAEGNRCPACGAKDWWFLSGEGISTANCGRCGAFYKVNERGLQSEETGEGG